jgi:hypothetical protein
LFSFFYFPCLGLWGSCPDPKSVARKAMSCWSNNRSRNRWRKEQDESGRNDSIDQEAASPRRPPPSLLARVGTKTLLGDVVEELGVQMHRHERLRLRGEESGEAVGNVGLEGIASWPGSKEARRLLLSPADRGRDGNKISLIRLKELTMSNESC